MTTNAGSKMKETAMGFNRKQEKQAEKVERALTQFLRPEFLARMDEVVVFRPLEQEDYRRIAALMLEN